MSESRTDPIEYYAYPGFMTNPGEQADLLVGLPAGIPALCRVVQGCMLHIFWAERYGVVLPEERKQEVQLRAIPRLLARLRELDDRPLAETRPLENRLVGNCRDFSTMLCALLRHQGVPARARCGFGTYFGPDHYEDHWVCEYWQPEQQRWVMVDSQLDQLQQDTLGITFDPLDMPAGQFLNGGQAWRLCRAGQADPDKFGIFDMHGPWFVRGNLVRDLASLNKMELLPWDAWGIMDRDFEALPAEDMTLLDRVAGLTCAAENILFADIRSLYEDHLDLRVPPVITSYTQAGPQAVSIS
jgi:hypothetical protein